MRIVKSILFLAALTFLVGSFFLRPLRTGDGFEYLATLQAFFDHHTPDLRDVDLQRLNAILSQNKIENPISYDGFFPAKDGGLYGWHFWLYPLFAVPAKALLSKTGGNELAAFQVTNVLLFLLALSVVFFSNRDESSLEKRFLLGGLASVSPVIYYLRWTSPEAFTWSLVMMSLVFARRRSYVWATVSASLAAAQNPPILAISIYCLWKALRDKEYQHRFVSCLGVILSLLPYCFYYSKYGVLHLLSAQGATKFKLISASRTWSYLTDLNQGLVAYVPLLLVLVALSLYPMVRKRNAEGLSISIAIAMMILLSETTTNWNSAAAGLMRYAIWILPCLAYMISEFLPLTTWTRVLTLLAIGVHAGILALQDGKDNYLRMTPIASFVLRHAPALYDPEPEIFVERQLGIEVEDIRDVLPVAFAKSDGVVTKILFDQRSLAKLSDEMLLSPEYINELRRLSRVSENMVFINPPLGAVRFKTGTVALASEFLSTVSVRLESPAEPRDREVLLKIMVLNSGHHSYGHAGVPNILHLSYHINRDGQRILEEGKRFSLPGVLGPGKIQTVAVILQVPSEPGEYEYEILPVLEYVAWGNKPVRLQMKVERDTPGSQTKIVSLHHESQE